MKEESSKGKVLIIDDDKNILFTLSMRLEYLGYKVITADNGLEGLFMARSESPDTILLDIKMPGINGMEVLEGLKMLSPSSDVIIMTAYEDEDIPRKAISKNSFFFMRKPLSIPLLDHIIKKAIESKGNIEVSKGV